GLWLTGAGGAAALRRRRRALDAFGLEVVLLDDHGGAVSDRFGIRHDHLVTGIELALEYGRAASIAFAQLDLARLYLVAHHDHDLAAPSLRDNGLVWHQKRWLANPGDADLGEHPVTKRAILLI